MTPIAGSVVTRRSIDDLVIGDGTASCAHAEALCRSDAATSDLSDAIHALCAVHGASPSVIERGADAPGAEPFASWIQQAAVAFDQERQSLASLTAAIGPLPSTPRHAEAETAITAQRHALATLAGSGRAGCALGASLALLLDWYAVRSILEAAANRAGVMLPPCDLPPRTAVVAQAAGATKPGFTRALAFGAEQLILQHRGLWHVLAARAEARSAL